MKTKMMTVLALVFGALPVFAQEAAQAEAATGGGKSGLAAIAAAIAISVAALGGGLGQGRAAASALDGIARNPAANNKIFLSMILSLVFIESLVIYALVIAFRLV